MGLKGYRLWVMGQLDSTCRAPPRLPGSEPLDLDVRAGIHHVPPRAVALQVEI
jgi:hypothetical protein